MTRIRVAILSSVLLLVSLCGARVSFADTPLVLGVHPYKSPVKLHKAYRPLADYLAARLGRDMDVRISPDYRAHIEAVNSGRFALAYMGPASYVRLVEKYGPRPILARQVINGQATFQGKIVVREDSKLRALKELKGKRFAFGDRSSTMSHLVPRHMLLDAGIDIASLSKYQFLGSHDNVALAVLYGEYDAGAVKEAVYHKYAKRGLRALATTPALAEHLFVANPELGAQNIATLRAALLDLQNSPKGQQIMRRIKPGMTAMAPAVDKDYDNLRAILRELEGNGVEIE